MKIYLAAAYERRIEMRRYAAALRLLGHEITSNWIDSTCEDETTLSGDELCSLALQDLQELSDSELIVNFTGYGGRGGRHAEFGLAVARSIKAIVVGAREHIFHYLPFVGRCDDFLDLLLHLGRAA